MLTTGVFVCYVEEGSVAAKAGLRFGDQILQINGQTVAGIENFEYFSISIYKQFLFIVPHNIYWRIIPHYSAYHTIFEKVYKITSSSFRYKLHRQAGARPLVKGGFCWVLVGLESYYVMSGFAKFRRVALRSCMSGFLQHCY